MKTASGGRTSEEQEEWLGYLRSIGCVALVCKGHMAAIAMTLAVVDTENLG